MHTSFVLAAAFASVVAAESTAAPATTPAPGSGEPMGVNAFKIPADGKIAPAKAGTPFKVEWNAEGGKADGSVQIKVVYGPSTALTTGPVVYSAASNTGSAEITIGPSDVPDVSDVALVIEEEGEANNFSPKFDFSGGEGSADSGSASGSSAEPTASASPTETGGSTLETVASTGAEPSATDDFSSNSTVTGGANTAIATKSDYNLPTETKSGAAASASATGSSGTAVQVSFAALFAGLVATVFAL